MGDIIAAANRLLAAALAFTGDQSGATSKMIGLVPPVTVAECRELEAACMGMADALSVPWPQGGGTR